MAITGIDDLFEYPFIMISTYLTHISNLPKIKEKGDCFEKLCVGILSTHPEYTRRYTKVWLYDDIPNSIRETLKLPPIDKGLDAIALMVDSDVGGDLGTFVGSLFRQRVICNQSIVCL